MFTFKNGQMTTVKGKSKNADCAKWKWEAKCVWIKTVKITETYLILYYMYMQIL